MPQPTLFVCTLCRAAESNAANEISDGQQLFDQLKESLESQCDDPQLHLQPVRCMAACDRSCVVALAATNKLTFIFNQLSAERSIPDLLQFTRQYAANTSGNVPYKERPESLKKKLLAVLPPVPVETPSWTSF
jgi:predicted metal-binding protein